MLCQEVRADESRATKQRKQSRQRHQAALESMRTEMEAVRARARELDRMRREMEEHCDKAEEEERANAQFARVLSGWQKMKKA